MISIASGDGMDLIVAGAYGHTRLGEWVFGGVAVCWKDLTSAASSPTDRVGHWLRKELKQTGLTGAVPAPMSARIARLFKRKVIVNDWLLRRALAATALTGLLLGLAAWGVGRNDWANWCWAAGTIPVVVGLLGSMIRDFLAGRLGVDAVALVSMSGALVLGQNLAVATVIARSEDDMARHDFMTRRPCDLANSLARVEAGVTASSHHGR